MPTFTSPFTGDIVQPTDVSYYELDFSVDQNLAWPQYQSLVAGTIPVARIMNCNPLAGGLHINLPPGGQGSVGSDILFRNVGSETFSIVDYSGDLSVAIAPGEARYFYLTNNDTMDGEWGNFTYGTGTSSADAASLSGNGTIALNGKLATSTTVVTTSAIPTLSDSSRAVAYNWTGGLANLTLPSISNLSNGWFILLRNNGTGALTVTPSGTSTINGLPSITFNPQDSGIIVLDKNNSAFYTVGLANPANVTFTSATYDVDSIIGNELNLNSYAPIIQTYVALAGTRTETLAVTLPAITQIYVLQNNTVTSSYNITFQVSGSSQPPLAFASGTVAIVLSDGNGLYLLTQTSAGTSFVDNGSASAPSYAFNNDVTSGMYLASLHQLGLAANGVNMFLLNASNLGDLEVSTPATFNAALISGGTF